ncbi:beta strand repeat-containing protein [Mesoterricola silvestris]|uniref:Ig-like domain-containing protein n=1 Tax=Mesoterricola silvestris TaxID=2927979 RepID=A0AA48K823_9BACT|nr:right-handed parallel beta-helix repeat-containing protein [Mesoterricola silvestris]BDU71781.1 hypothetical protein METEAL_09550 [Mesoterricola silvestris]
MSEKLLAGGLFNGRTAFRSSVMFSAALALALVAGGSSSLPLAAATTSTWLKVSPSDSLTITGGTSVTYGATVSGLSTYTVKWYVDGIQNGNSTVGTLVPTSNPCAAVYKSPTGAGQHTILAIATQDSSHYTAGSKGVTVLAGTPTATPITVAASPSSLSMTTGAAASVSATVSGSTNTAVTWTVDGVTGGNSTVGTLSGTGSTVTYTAPATAGSHTLKATSAANTASSATVAVTVSAPAVQVTTSPSSLCLLVSASGSVTASVSGSTNTAVTWTVDGVTGGNSTVGTLSGTGSTVTYTAPAAAGSHTLKATSAANPAYSASVAVTVAAPVAVSLSPAGTSSVSASGSFNFQAAVTGTTNTAVTWSVDGILGGNSTVGTLSGSGTSVTYAAPSASGNHTVTVTSAADPTKSASAVISVVAVSGTTTGITLTPSVPTAVGSGGQKAFAASIAGSTSDSVTWSVDGIAGGNSTVGTISSSGVYTCPSVSAKTVRTITATSVANPSVKASVRILTVVSNTTLNARTQYGATGNGTTDDTAAIMKALAATGNGICYVPAGTYLINPIATSSQFGLYLNPGNTLLLDPGAVLQCKTMTTSGGYSVVGMKESDIALVGGTIIGDRVARNLGTYINGTGSDVEIGNGVAIGNASGMTILGTTSKNNCNDGFYIYNNVSNVLLSDCVSDNNRRQGCSLVYCNGIVIQYSTFSNTNGNDPACGLDFEPNSGSTVTNVQVIGCNIFGNLGGGIAGGGSTKNGPTGNGTAFCTNCVITGCTITGNGGSNYMLGGIAWDESSNIVFSNNAISKNKGDGIWIDYYSMNFKITGNTVTSNQGDGIYVAYCTGTQVSGNTLSGNTGTAINNADGTATVGTNTIK